VEGALEAYDPTTSDPNELKRLLTFSKKAGRHSSPFHLNLTV